MDPLAQNYRLGWCVRVGILARQAEEPFSVGRHGETDRPTACGLLVQPPHTTCKEAIKGPLLPVFLRLAEEAFTSPLFFLVFSLIATEDLLILHS